MIPITYRSIFQHVKSITQSYRRMGWERPTEQEMIAAVQLEWVKFKCPPAWMAAHTEELEKAVKEAMK